MNTAPDASIIYGVHPVRELLRAKKRKIRALHVVQPVAQAVQKILQEVPKHIPYIPTTKEKLTRLCGTDDHQGIVAVADPLPIRKKPFDPAKEPFIVLLDGIQDARNLGAILRSASCVGVDGVIVPVKNSAPLSGVVWKASAGLAEHLAITQPPTALQAAKELKDAGYQLYGASMEGADIRSVTFTAPLCLVIGSEGSGLSAALRQMSTLIAIPQRTSDISYNASVAAGIILYAASAQLRRM